MSGEHPHREFDELMTRIVQQEQAINSLRTLLYDHDGDETRHSGTPTDPEPPQTTHLMVSTNPQRTNAVPLTGTLSGDAYVFWDGPASGVDFYLDGNLTKAERAAPFDMMGTRPDGTANDLNTRAFANGEHTIEARTQSGEIETVSVTFENAEVPPVDPPPPTDGVSVPANASRQWIIDRYNAGDRLFLHTHDWVGRGPLPGLDGIRHIGVPVLRGPEVAITPSGKKIYTRVTPAGMPKLTISSDESVITPTSGRPKNVVLRGFEITGSSRDFGTPDDTADLQQGIVDGALFDNLVVDANWIHHNDGTAVRIGPGIIVTGNLINHNTHLGIGGVNSGGSPLIASNELHGNSTGVGHPLWEKGEIKVVLGHERPHGAILANYIHDGTSYAIWVDIDGNWWVQDNYVVNMPYQGIFYEAGRRCADGPIQIVGNLCERNGYQGHPNLWDAMEANICVSEQAGVLVKGNKIRMVSSRERGLTLKQQKRFDHHDRTGEWMYTDDVEIVDNEIERLSGNGHDYITYADDTDSHTEDEGFIKNFLKNRDDLSVPAERRATIIVGSNNLH